MLRSGLLEQLEHISPAADASVGCRRPPAPKPKQGLERLPSDSCDVCAKDEFIEMRLELGTAHAVIGADRPLLRIPDGAARWP